MNSVTTTPQLPAAGQRFVRYMLGFGISVAVGLAPFLGKFDVPLFEPLLNILPPDEQNVAIPISAILMGIIAVGVQWYAYEKLSQRRLGRVFVCTLVLAIVAVIAFYIVNVLVVTRIPVGDDTAVILHGFASAQCQECTGKSHMECIRDISFNPTRVEACWGSAPLQVARISLSLSYLSVTAFFGVVVGVLTVRRPRR